MPTYFDIPVIIPAYEPDEKLIVLLKQLQDAGITNIVVVDDGSRASYAELFEQAAAIDNCTVLHHAVNLGKGRALKTAFNYCLMTFKDILGCITADSDGQHTPQDILSCMKKLWDNPDSLILGCRNFDAEDVPLRSSFGNKCTRKVFGYLIGISVSDTQTGLRAIPVGFMTTLMNVKGERFEFETNMLIETKSLNISILEVPISTIYLEKNKTSHFDPIKDSIRIYVIFGKFLFSSLSSSVLDLVLFSLFCRLLESATGFFGNIPYIIGATVLARIISAVYNFFLNYKVVFKSDAGIMSTAVKYFLLAVCQMLCSAFLVNAIFGIVGGWETAVKVPVDVILFFLSFVIQREFVYKKNDKVVG